MSATFAVAHYECVCVRVCVEGHALMTVENKALYQKSLDCRLRILLTKSFLCYWAHFPPEAPLYAFVEIVAI